MKIIKSEKHPIILWLNNIEDGALNQAKNLANLKYVFKHIAIMPDAHQGFGMPIGGVLATKDVIIPNAVGVDIGCGMCAVKTSLSEISKDELINIFNGIKTVVPLGFKHHKIKQPDNYMPNINNKKYQKKIPIVINEYENARTQIGTLGGGNHFIEIQKGSDQHIWIMLHSGSRNIGYKVANHYNKIAKELNLKWKCEYERKNDLAFLPFDSDVGNTYYNEMQYCIDFALANRSLMLERIKEIIEDVIKDVKFDEVINIAHNYAAIEEHFNKKVIVHRKGATKATKGLLGIIPGSQGAKSYIVIGKGNSQSFMSCSHGAGRKLGRREARRKLDLKTEIKKLENQGIFHSIKNITDLDEASGAYKDINIVMDNQKDLVKIILELSPLGVIKG